MLKQTNTWILKHYLQLSIGLIVAIHVGLHWAGLPQSMHWSFHILGLNHFEKDFFTNLFYFHTSPPLLSFIHYLAFLTGNRDLALTVLLIVLHGVAFYNFYGFCQKIKLKYAEPICLIFLLNPYLFIYFKNAGHSTFLFANCCIIINILFSDRSNNKKLIFFTLIFAFNSLLRPTWNLPFIAILLAPFWYKVQAKYIGYSFLILLLPFGVYLKNYLVFGKFATNTQGGMALAKAHIPPTVDYSTRTVSRFYPFLTQISEYKDYVNENDPFIQKFKDIEVLNISVDNNLAYTNSQMNNVRYIKISDMYMADVIRNFNWKHSLAMVIQGYFVYMDSPADYDVLRPSYPSKWWTYDFFDIPNWFKLKFWRLEIKNISLYLFVYTLALVVVLYNIRRLKFEDYYILFTLFIFTSVYITVDYYEANRYRFEFEPFWFYIVVLALRKGKRLSTE